MTDAPPATPLEATRRRLSFVIGAVMLGLGCYVALHPLWSRTPVTGNRWMDMAFVAFFLLRGALYVRALRRARR